ncbi:MAG TPA: surface-adhesin E family protein [Nitrospirota bacterium]|nr:surface-adhesin E family protein [Nitrospirota bacterium]
MCKKMLVFFILIFTPIICHADERLSSTSTVSSTETSTQPSAEGIADRLEAEAANFSYQATKAKDDKVFYDRTIKVLESCKKIGDGETGKEGKCIRQSLGGEEFSSGGIFSDLFVSKANKKVLESKYKRRYSLVERAIDTVYMYGDMQKYAIFYLSVPAHYLGSIYHNFQNAWGALTSVPSTFDSEQLINMYYRLAYCDQFMLLGASNIYLFYKLTSPKLAHLPDEVRQAATDGCKKCLDSGYSFDFAKCKELCVASYVIEGTEKRGPDWKYFSDSSGSGHDEIFLFNSAKIQRRSKKDVRVWERSEPVINNYDDIKSYEQTKNFSHSLMLYQFDCVNAEMKILSGINYDSDEKITESYLSPSGKIAIVPGSVGESLFDIVCKTKKSK